MSQLSVKWIFVLNQDFVFNVRSHLPKDFSRGCAFVDRSGKRRLELHPNGDAKVLANYELPCVLRLPTNGAYAALLCCDSQSCI